MLAAKLTELSIGQVQLEVTQYLPSDGASLQIKLVAYPVVGISLQAGVLHHHQEDTRLVLDLEPKESMDFGQYGEFIFALH